MGFSFLLHCLETTQSKTWISFKQEYYFLPSMGLPSPFLREWEQPPTNACLSNNVFPSRRGFFSPTIAVLKKVCSIPFIYQQCSEPTVIWQSVKRIRKPSTFYNRRFEPPKTSQGGCGCPIPGGIQGQAGCGSGQPGLMVGDPAHSRGVETRWSLWSSSKQAILWFSVVVRTWLA